MNRRNDTAAAVDLLTSKSGDYPVDPGSMMQPTNWPIASGNQAIADAWRVALYDWVKRAGTKANIDSVLAMQLIPFDAPSTSTVDWMAPLTVGGAYLNLGTIPAGIIHIYTFDPDGYVNYQSKLHRPYPMYVSSNEQLYAEAMMPLANSAVGADIKVVPGGRPDGTDAQIRLRPVYDVYIRDEVRNYGTIRGGKHGGEPLAKPTLANTDNGSPTAMNTEIDSLAGKAVIASTTVGAGAGAFPSISISTTPGGGITVTVNGGGTAANTFSTVGGITGNTYTGTYGGGGAIINIGGGAPTTAGATNGGAAGGGATGGAGAGGTIGAGGGGAGAGGAGAGAGAGAGGLPIAGTNNGNGGTNEGGAGLPGVHDKGYPPLIAPQSDFGEQMVPASPLISPMPAGGGVRPFYTTEGTAVDIRFRRQVDVTELTTRLGDTGYIGITAPSSN